MQVIGELFGDQYRKTTYQK